MVRDSQYEIARWHWMQLKGESMRCGYDQEEACTVGFCGKDCLFKFILDIAHVGILITDNNGDIKYLNPKYAEMFKFDIKEALTKNINDYFVNSKLMEVIKTGKPDMAMKFSFKGQDALVNRHPIVRGGETIGGIIEVYFRDIAELNSLMSRMTSLEQKVRYYKRKVQALPGAKYSFDDIVGNSEVIRSLRKKGLQFAKNSQPILVLGESGTGKELVAHATHSASLRAAEVFISINCAAIPKDLLESELFGYEEGTFTGARLGGKVGKFELADRGTIFLDEIGDLPLEMQAKLLRVIENKEIQKIGTSSPVYSDFRLVAATNKNLEACVAMGSFREDLYHRLNMLALRVPALRERPEDILVLAQHILDTLEDKPQDYRIELGPKVKQLFNMYLWPGNIREMKNVLSYAVFSLEEGQSEISLRNLPPHIIEKGILNQKSGPTAVSSLSHARQESEKEAILSALELSANNKAKAAKVLGISRNEMYKKLRRYGLGGSRRAEEPES